MDPRRALASLVPLLLLAAAPAGAKPAVPRGAAVAAGPVVDRSLPVLGEVLRIEAAARPGVTDTALAARAVERAFEEAARLEGVLDAGRGELARLNATAAEARFACSPELFEAVSLAREVAAATGGAWDPTAGALAKAGTREAVGWRMLGLEPAGRTVRFQRAGMRLELEPLAQGFVLDRIALVLRQSGVVRGRLSLGPATLAFTNGEGWALEAPDPDGRPAAGLPLANAAAGTAGRWSPVIDPRSGRPATAVAGVTVVARSAASAAALARALLVLGREEASAHAAAHPELGVLWAESAPDDGVRLWAWNLGRVEPAAGRAVERVTTP